MVEDIVNESWFWGRLQRTSERGMIPRNYTVDAVSNNLQHLLFFLWDKFTRGDVYARGGEEVLVLIH